MFARVRNLTLAGGSALALTILLSGVVAAATVLTAFTVATDEPAPIADTAATFQDLDGNGIADECQTGDVVPDADAAAAAAAAADQNGDGTISVDEAAQSDRTGGTNCNHGGYVSVVASEDCTSETPEDATETDADDSEDADDSDGDDGVDADEAVARLTEQTEPDEDAADCDAEEAVDEPKPDEAPTCDTAPEPTSTEPADEPAATVEAEPEDEASNAHGKAVAEVAQSDAVGGKNCNHGGAVSEAAKKGQEAARDARAAAKTAREAARDAAAKAREAARDARRIERLASHAGKGHGRGGG